MAGEGHGGLARRFKAWSLDAGVSLDDAPLYVSKAPASLLDPDAMTAVVSTIDDVVRATGLSQSDPRL